MPNSRAHQTQARQFRKQIHGEDHQKLFQVLRSSYNLYPRRHIACDTRKRVVLRIVSQPVDQRRGSADGIYHKGLHSNRTPPREAQCCSPHEVGLRSSPAISTMRIEEGNGGDAILVILQITTMLLVALAMPTAVAHALALSGKIRLPRAGSFNFFRTI